MSGFYQRFRELRKRQSALEFKVGVRRPEL